MLATPTWTEAGRIVDRSLEAGVNLIDTADVYSDGVSEEMVGQIVKTRRHDLFLATKCGFPPRRDQWRR